MKEHRRADADRMPFDRGDERLLEGDELGAPRLRARDDLIATRQLEGGLVGLGARVAKEGAAFEGPARERVGEAELVLEVIEVRGVDEAPGLGADDVDAPLSTPIENR